MPDTTSPFRRPTSRGRGELLLAFAAVYVLWGSTYLAIRVGVETIPPFILAGTRHLTAGLLLYGWLRLRGTAAPERRQWIPAAIIGALMLLGGNGLVTWAEQRVSSGIAALIVASVPIWMTVIDAIHRRERPHGVVLLGLAIGLGGIAFLIAPGQFAGGTRVDPLGAAALLTAALMWSIGSLYGRRAKLPSSTLLATAMEMIAGGAVLFLASAVTREWGGFSLSAVSARSALSLSYLVVAGSLLGFTAYVFLLRATTPARVSTYAYVNPVVAVLLGWAMLGEALTPRILIAAAVIVAAVALIIRHGAQRKAASPAEEAEESLRVGTGRN
ncbi:MAG TPA: drug/metabolite exporter YedA [Thermoanaerobaculia bacterium]|nr:drug/metabolite exporter YedA [Thermoanaerobaculia bacterium]